MSEDRQRHRYAPEPRRWYRTTWFAAVAVVVFVAVVMIVAVIPVWATDTPSYCSSCKTMQPAGETWQRSVHSSVSCTDCHVPPGLANDTKWRTRELLNIWADYLNVPQTADRRQRPGNENCLKCHNVDNIPEDNGAVRMPHDAHLNLRNLTCADCHSQVAHPEEGKTGTEISMAVCSMCHEEATSTTACMFCHLEPQAKDVHPKGYMETHGKRARQDLDACLRCHHSEADFCDPCHAKPTPDHFSGTWRYDHGKTALKDRDGCLGCHSETDFCDQCHRVRHPDDWLETHWGPGAESRDGCLVCHPRSMCDRCHARQGVTDR